MAIIPAPGVIGPGGVAAPVQEQVEFGRRGSLAGLGDCYLDPESGEFVGTDCAGAGSGGESVSGTVGCPAGMISTGTGCYDPISGGSSGSSGASSGPSWWQSLLNQWTKIGGQVLAPTTNYTRGPNGEIIYSAPGTVAPPTSIVNSSNSSLLIVGGIALVGLMLLMGSKK